jgi:hypothetical protein
VARGSGLGGSQLEAGSWELGAGSWELEAGSWKLGAGSCELKAGSWKLGAVTEGFVFANAFLKNVCIMFA